MPYTAWEMRHTYNQILNKIKVPHGQNQQALARYLQLILKLVIWIAMRQGVSPMFYSYMQIEKPPEWVPEEETG
jgi:hypothetical protein